MPPATKKPVSLADLSPADRERLLAEAKRGDGEVSEEAIAKAAERVERIAKLMSDRDHAEGCPAEPGRMEAYAQRTPPRPQESIPAKDVTVVHCIECGATRRIDRPFSEVEAELSDPDKEIGT